MIDVSRANPRARYYPVPKIGGEPLAGAKRLWETSTITDRQASTRRCVCYVTAACLKALGLAEADRCYEICLLRLFWGEHVAKLADGPRVISDYRRKSPRILRAIENLEDPRGVYLCIHERWLVPWLGLVSNGWWDEAYTVYCEMHGTLEGEFLMRRQP